MYNNIADSKVLVLPIPLQNNIDDELSELKGALSYERNLRQMAEQKVYELEEKLKEYEVYMKRKKTKEEQRLENLAKLERMKTGLKKDGKPIRKETIPLKNFEDYSKLGSSILQGVCGKRDYFGYILALATGLRPVDYLSLKYDDIWNEDGTFKERLYVIEKKTGKINSVIPITEVIKVAANIFLDGEDLPYTLDRYIFQGRDPRKPLTVGMFRKIVQEASIKAKLDDRINLASLRTTFTSIIQTISKSKFPQELLMRAQVHLNHSDPKVSMRYSKPLQEIIDKQKNDVSDFLLGKTEKKELIFEPEIYTIDDIMSKLDRVESKIGGLDVYNNQRDKI